VNKSSLIAFLLTLVFYSLVGLVFYYGVFLLPNKQTVELAQEVPIQLSMFEIPEPPAPPVEPPPPPLEPPPPPKAKPKPKKKKVVKKVKKKEAKPVKKPPPPKPVVKPAPVSKPTPVKKPVEPPPRFTQQQIATAEQQYLSELRNQLASYAQDTYPRRAKRRNWESEVTVSFTLLRSGRIVDLKVVKPGTRDIFDQAAIDIFEDKFKLFYKKFPEEIERSQWQIQIPISYSLRR